MFVESIVYRIMKYYSAKYWWVSSLSVPAIYQDATSSVLVIWLDNYSTLTTISGSVLDDLCYYFSRISHGVHLPPFLWRVCLIPCRHAAQTTTKNVTLDISDGGLLPRSSAPLLTELLLIMPPQACCDWMLPSKPTCQCETGSPWPLWRWGPPSPKEGPLTPSHPFQLLTSCRLWTHRNHSEE